jgi:hypothetical protein
VLLVLVPLVTGYVAYKKTKGERLFPIHLSTGTVAAVDITNG